MYINNTDAKPKGEADAEAGGEDDDEDTDSEDTLGLLQQSQALITRQHIQPACYLNILSDRSIFRFFLSAVLNVCTVQYCIYSIYLIGLLVCLSVCILR